MPKQSGKSSGLLRRLQKEESARQALRCLEAGLDYQPTAPALDFAREGPGTDPSSPIGQWFAHMRDPQAHEPVLQTARLFYKDEDVGLEKCLPRLSDEPEPLRITEGDSSTSVAERPASEDKSLKSLSNFIPLLADWSKREWFISDSDDIMGYFRRWLENLNLGEEAAHAPRLEDKEPFLAGDLHLNPASERGVDAYIEHPPTVYDMDDEIGAPHLHETALGYSYNWQEKVLC